MEHLPLPLLYYSCMKRMIGHAGDAAKFLGHFITSPQKTGAVLPSSSSLARIMADDMGLEKAKLVVDVGAGTGVFTGETLKRVRPGTKVIAIEINPHFARIIRRKYPRVTVISDSVEHLAKHLRKAGHRHADAILCGLPWSHFPDSLQKSLLNAMYDSLKPGGKFASFAYIHSAWWPSARRFKRLLKTRFRKTSRSRIAWLNVPPAFVHRCVK